LSLGEDVGLLGGGNADRSGDRVRRLELGRDHEVDVDLALLPGLDVLRVRGAHDRLRARELLGEHRSDEVDLVTGRAGDHERSPIDPGVLQDAARSAVARHRTDVIPVRERLKATRIDVDDRDVVLVVESFDDRHADLPGAEDDDVHTISGA
jgi:hypothetical protein